MEIQSTEFAKWCNLGLFLVFINDLETGLMGKTNERNETKCWLLL